MSSVLAYPLIDIPSKDWLHLNLLLHDQVKRIVPSELPSYPPDQGQWGDYLRDTDVAPALLANANLSSELCKKRQSILARKIGLQRDESSKFLEKHGIDGASNTIRIHKSKLNSELRELIERDDLSRLFAANDRSNHVVEVNNTLGEAIMATLGIAVAENEGLSITSNLKNGKLHRVVSEKNNDEVFDTWLNYSGEAIEIAAPSPNELFSAVIGAPWKVGNLTIEDIRQLQEERAAIQALMERLVTLGEREENWPQNKEMRHEALAKLAIEAIEDWQKNYTMGKLFRAQIADNIGGSIAKLLNSSGTAFVGSIFAKEAIPGISEMAESATPNWFQTDHGSKIILAGAGFVISLGWITGKSYIQAKKEMGKSPYRYLTSLDDAGVIIDANR